MEDAFRDGNKAKPITPILHMNGNNLISHVAKNAAYRCINTLGITREDDEGKMNQWAANFRAFDAPVMLLFFFRGCHAGRLVY